MPFRVAILGTGGIADHQLAPAVVRADGVQLWSVLSRDEDRALAFAERHEAASPTPAYTDLDRMLSDAELDGVIIATPDALHATEILAAVAAGKHVLVEKPMVTSVEDGQRVVEAAEQAGVVVAVAYHLRFHAGHKAVARLVRDGELGDLRHMRVQWTWPARDDSNWRAAPEVGRWWSLAGVGTHCLDLIRWLMVPTCGEVTSIHGTTSNAVWQGPHDETAVVSMAFESGATAAFCSSVQFQSPPAVEVYGSRGYAIGRRTLGPHGAGSIATRAGKVRFEIENPYVGEIVDFAEAVRDGRRPEVDAREGLRNVELLSEIA